MTSLGLQTTLDGAGKSPSTSSDPLYPGVLYFMNSPLCVGGRGLFMWVSWPISSPKANPDYQISINMIKEQTTNLLSSLKELRKEQKGWKITIAWVRWGIRSSLTFHITVIWQDATWGKGLFGLIVWGCSPSLQESHDSRSDWELVWTEHEATCSHHCGPGSRDKGTPLLRWLPPFSFLFRLVSNHHTQDRISSFVNLWIKLHQHTQMWAFLMS